METSNKSHHHLSQQNTTRWNEAQALRDKLIFGYAQPAESNANEADISQRFCELSKKARAKSAALRNREVSGSKASRLLEGRNAASLESALEQRINKIGSKLADCRWEIENQLLPRQADASVHLDNLANEFRYSVRDELRRFQVETEGKSTLYRSLIDTATKRFQFLEEGKLHHLPSIRKSGDRPSAKSNLPVHERHSVRPANQGPFELLE